MDDQQHKNNAADGRSDSTVGLDTDGDLTIIGIAFVDLGKAMQDKNTTIDELAALAFKVGLRLQIRICD